MINSPKKEAALRQECFFKMWLLICVFSLFTAQNAFSFVLTLDDAVRQGLDNSLSLQRSRIDVFSAEFAANRLWSEVFPSISGNVGASYNIRTGGNFSAGLGISVTFNTGIPYVMRNIRLAYQSRLLSYEDARNRLEIEITKFFFTLIAEYYNLAVLSDMMLLAQRQHDRNQIAFNNGFIGERVLMQSRLSLENARFNLSAARSIYANRMAEFLSLLGLPHDEQPKLAGTIEIGQIAADAERLIIEDLPRRPDIISRRREIERLENSARQAVFSGRAPSLSLSFNWSDPNLGSNQFADSLRGSATLNIPIDTWVPGSRADQSIQNARLDTERARIDLQNAKEMAAFQIRSLVANLQNLWYSIEIARLSLNVAERGYVLTEQGFHGGTVESLVLEDARNNLSSARQRLLQSELSYLIMFLDLSAALNRNWQELMRDYMLQE